MTTVISFVVVLGVLIFIHELGHFAVAKWRGVGVERFSLGFGPKIFGVKKGETEYLISLLPLGGYVKMVGEAPGEDVSDEVKNKSFAGKSVFTRGAIVAAGPLMNLVLAAFLLPIIFMLGIQAPAYLDKPVVAGFVAPDEPAAKAGIRAGDAITAVDGKKIKDWEEFLETVELEKTVKLTVRRDNADIEIMLTPASSKETAERYAGIYPALPPVIGGVNDGYPAKEAGLRPGDMIMSVDGKPVGHWAELEDLVHKSGGKKVFVVERDGKAFTLEITPKLNKDMNVYLIGVTRKVDTVTRRYGFFQATVKGISAGVEMTGRLFEVIKGLVIGKYSIKTLGGPLMIAQVAGKAAKAGAVDLLTLVAFLSLQLGVINLFPIPVLDGGHILFYAIELIKGKPLSERFMVIAQQVGIALLVGLMLLVTYNDIFRIIGKM
ncbi:MAG: RIP metalloprotease RseP [Deltaproteobacteria bacterium]|nr:RIP metalloprotease RseP [Deltaproteobacteria bacterium]